jgi:putative pyruvate formate lyase activating enzyme
MDVNNGVNHFQPAYLSLLENGELHKRVYEAYQRLERCELCGVKCRVNRRTDKLGSCRTGELARLSSYGPHMGEEAALRGWRGSGTVFFAGCNLRCQFCQNYDISQMNAGEEVEPQELAAAFLELQKYGCHNINLVTPSHVIPQILAAVEMAAFGGLRLPLVYNTGGYDSVEALQLLDGVVDIYMPDMKYGNSQIARRYSRVINYPTINQDAVREMHRQVGDLQIGVDGLARRGLLVRHLVLPHGLAGTKEVMRFLAEEISLNTYVNIMDQYHPALNAHLYASLNRTITLQEHHEAIEMAKEVGLKNLIGG